MVKKIILATESPFTLRDYKRFGIEIFKSNNLDVEIWDLTRIIHPEYNIAPPDPFSSGELKIFGVKNDVLRLVSKLDIEKTLVLNLNVGWLDRIWFYRVLTKYRVRFAVMALGILPTQHANAVTQTKKSIFKKLTAFKFSCIHSYFSVLKTRVMRRIPFKYFGVSAATYFLASGELSPGHYYFPVDKSTETIWLHALDYDLYLETNKKPIFQEPLNKAIFLDAYMPYHPDFVLLGEKNPVTPEKYFSSLNSFFSKVEKRLNTKVEICAHPRADYSDKPDCFNGRKLYFGKTIECVRSAKFIIAHSSTSLYFAILYRKPVIFIVTEEMKRNKLLGVFVDILASWFGKNAINIDKDYSIDWESELLVDEKRYEHFQTLFIKKADSREEFTWQILADRLRGDKADVN